MCIIIGSYVTLCRFCAVRCLIIICLYVLFSGAWGGVVVKALRY